MEENIPFEIARGTWGKVEIFLFFMDTTISILMAANIGEWLWWLLVSASTCEVYEYVGKWMLMNERAHYKKKLWPWLTNDNV